MNKIFPILITILAIIALILIIILPGGSITDIEETFSSEDIPTSSQPEETLGERQLRLTWDNKEIIVDLAENSTVDDLVAELPITVSLEDYNNTEKIAYLDNELSQSSEGYTPKKGDLAYYVPWKNISIFYEDFTYSDSLVKLGEVSKGLNIIDEVENQEITIELITE